jgi:hypothetical protein
MNVRKMWSALFSERRKRELLRRRLQEGNDVVPEDPDEDLSSRTRSYGARGCTKRRKHHDKCDGEQDPVPDLGVQVEGRSTSTSLLRAQAMLRSAIHARHRNRENSASDGAEVVEVENKRREWRAFDRVLPSPTRARVDSRYMSLFGNTQNTGQAGGTPAAGTGTPSLFGGGGAFGGGATAGASTGVAAPSLFGSATPAAGAGTGGTSAFGGFGTSELAHQCVFPA